MQALDANLDPNPDPNPNPNPNPNQVKALSTSNPLSSKTLGKDLIGYWCIYQRPEGSSQIKNGVRLAGEQQFDGTYLMEGAP